MRASHSYESYCLAAALFDLGDDLVCDQSRSPGFAADQFRWSAFYQRGLDFAGHYLAAKNFAAKNKTSLEAAGCDGLPTVQL